MPVIDVDVDLNMNLNATLDVDVDTIIERSEPIPWPLHLADQLLRAAQSQPRNIAEGAGRRTPVNQARFYAHARGLLEGSSRCSRR